MKYITWFIITFYIWFIVDSFLTGSLLKKLNKRIDRLEKLLKK